MLERDLASLSLLLELEPRTVGPDRVASREDGASRILRGAREAERIAHDRHRA
jgi:hypothetical protein